MKRIRRGGTDLVFHLDETKPADLRILDSLKEQGYILLPDEPEKEPEKLEEFLPEKPKEKPKPVKRQYLKKGKS